MTLNEGMGGSMVAMKNDRLVGISPNQAVNVDVSVEGRIDPGEQMIGTLQAALQIVQRTLIDLPVSHPQAVQIRTVVARALNLTVGHGILIDAVAPWEVTR